MVSSSQRQKMSFSLYQFVEVLRCTGSELSASSEGTTTSEIESATANEFTLDSFAFTSDSKALIVAAVSSCHELIFVHGCADSPKDLKSIKFPWCHDPEKRISCISLSPSGCWLACVLENGSIEIVPTKLALGDVFTTRTDPGINPLFSEEEFTFIHLSIRSDGLGLPTRAVWYETRSRRPMLVYSNKGGDILFVDLMIRKLSVTLQAPQSIHNLEIVQDAALTDIYLLVTGFAGTQWMVPLEQGDLTMRETLANIIPSELKEIGYSDESYVFSVESRGTKCIGVLRQDLNRFQVYNTVNLMNPAFDIGLPCNTSTVHYADSVTFSLKNQSEIIAALNISSAMDQPQVIEAEVSRKLSILTTYRDTGARQHHMIKQFSLLDTLADKSDDCLPGCFVITDTGIFYLMPACGGDDLFLTCLIPKFNLSAAETLCMTLELDFRSTVYSVVPRMLADRSLEPEMAMKLCEASEMPIADVVRVFCEHGHHTFILPHLEAWLLQRRVMTDMAREELSKLAFEMHMRLIGEAVEYERHAKEHSFRDFLLHNPWYPAQTCLEELISKKLWSCASVLLKVHDLFETAVRELLAMSPLDWGTSDSFVELLTLPDHARLFTDRWELAGDFLRQLENFSLSWTEKRHLKNLLALTNPQRPEIHSLLNLDEASVSSVFLTVVGEIYVTGNGVYGQLGLTTTKKRCFPEKLQAPGLENVAHIGTGFFHNVALTEDARLFTWGATPQSLKFKALLQKRKQAAESKGDRPNGSFGSLQTEGLAAIEGKHLRPTEIDLSQAIVKSERIIQLECAFHHSAFLTESGQLYTWGKNLEFQLGHTDKKERSTPTLVTSIGIVRKLRDTFFSQVDRHMSEAESVKRLKLFMSGLGSARAQPKRNRHQ